MRLLCHSLLVAWLALRCNGRRDMQLGRRIVEEDSAPSSLKPLAAFLFGAFHRLPASQQLGMRFRPSLAFPRWRPSPVAQADSRQEPQIATLPLSEDGEKLLQSLVDASGNPEDLRQRIEDSFDHLGGAEIRAILNNAQEGDSSWKEVALAFEEAKHKRLMTGKELLEDLLSSGELRKMDAKLSKMVKDERITPAFLGVLNTNYEAAVNAGDDMRMQLLSHLSTMVSEELEKLTSPEKAVLNRLMRQDDVGIRSNLLNHYLTPQTEILLPDGEKIQLDEPKPALVHPMKFSEAVSEMVNTLRSLDVPDGEMITGLVDDVKLRAKEARAVIVENYPESVVDEFSDALTPVFQPEAAAAGGR